MKTSKRILSFFLAVVMALTACSAGFVAFARETNPKDNNPFSDEFASADKSIDALNGLLDSLLPTILDAIGEETLASIGLDKNKIVNASFDDESIKSDRFYELISELSVYLYGLIGATDMEKVLNNEGLSSGDAEKDAADYAYLLNTNEDEQNDFWTLYNLCKSNAKQDGTEFEQRCNDYYNGYTKEDGTVVTGLKDLLFARSTVEPTVSALSAGANKKVFDIATELGIIQKNGENTVILDKTPAEIQALIDAYESANGTIPTETDEYDLAIAISTVNGALGMIKSDAECSTLADLIYYQIIEEKTLFASVFNVAAIEGGADTGVAADSYDTWFADTSKAYTLEAYIQDTFGGAPTVSDDVVNGMYRQALADKYAASIIENQENLESDKFYPEYVIGLLSLLNYSTPEESKEALKEFGLRDEDIEWLMTNPRVEAHTVTAEEKALYPKAVNNANANALGNTYAFYNTLVLDIAGRGFSDAVRSTFAQYAPSGLTAFRTQIRNGNKNALNDILPEAAKEIEAKSYAELAKTYFSSVNSISIFNKQVATEYADKLLSKYTFNDADYPISTENYFEVTAATIDGYIEMAKDLDGLLASLGVNLELGLNEVVTMILSALTQTKDADGNPLTYELVINSVDGIYSNLAKNPMGTIANVIPLLAILLDEIILPLIFNEQGDAFFGFIHDLTIGEGSMLKGLGDIYDTIMGYVEEYGIAFIGFDLNTILPAVTNYMATGSLEGLNFYEGYTTANGEQVPIITNIRIADEFILENFGNCKFLEGMDAGVAELLKSVIGVLNTTVNNYVNTHNTNETADARLGAGLDGTEAPLARGLNNIGVALPELISGFVQNFLALYNTKGSDWQFNARISHATGVVRLYSGGAVISETEYGTADNATIAALKQEIFVQEPSNVTAWIVNLLVSDWLNAVIDLLNDVFTTENDIEKNIPIITTLLNSLGGFGETSVISDVLNGLFYLTRESKYSFAFSEQNIPLAQNGETYVGLSDNTAYYLIANVGPIIEIVMNIVNAPPAEDDNNNSNDDNKNDDDNNNSPVVTTNINIKYSDAAAILTAENEKASAALISALDTLLSTVFENTYFNGYTVDKLDGILSGLVAFLINHFGNNITDKILQLVIDYLEVICNESIQQKFAPKRNVNNPGAVNEKKVYSNKELSILVTETYSLLEEILDSLIDIPGDDNDYIVNAIDGVFSPSSIAVRSSLNNDIMEFLTWSELSATKYSTDLGFDFKAGDKDAFYDNLFEALAPVTAILGALLSSESVGLYDSLINPIFSSICNKCGVELYTPANTTGKEYAKAVVFPVAELLNQFLQTPATTLVQLIQGLSNVLTDKSLGSIVKKLIPPITGEIRGLGRIVAVLSPELSKKITDWKIEVSEDFAIDLATIESLGTLINAVPNLVNTLLTDLEIGNVKLNVDFDWAGFANLSTGKALLVIYDLALDLVLDMGILQGIEAIKGNNTLLSLINKLDAKTVFETLVAAIKSVRTPTEILWTFENYLAKETNTFKYPSGITASSADDAVDSLDNLVKNIFPLLQSLGVLDYSNLSGVVNGLLFKNDMLTTIATAVYGGIEKAAAGTAGINFTFTPAQFADYLMDKSYGNTYSEAAAALRKCTSWNQVKNINWGFTDGSAKAEQGFINGLAALCRPVNDVLAVLLAGGELKLGDLINTVLNDLELVIKGELTQEKKDADGNVIKDKNGNPVTEVTGTYTIVLRDGALGIYLGDDKPLYDSIVIKVSEIAEVLNGAGIMGGNGYQSAIIPLLETLMCDGVKTNAQYINDYNKAKDNLIINILNPLFGFVDRVLEKPFDTITAVLPNIAYFIDNNGIGQLLNNLLSPITQALPILKNGGIDVNAIIESLMGESLGKKIAGLVGINADINLNLNNLNACDIQDYLIQIINAVLKSYNINITLPDFKWSTLASHGTQTTFNSAAGGQGIRIIAKQGETLVAVLRYLADTIISNANALKTLICGIDGVKNNKTIVNILTTVFNQLSGAHEDDIVKAIFYFLTQDPQNRFFDYRDFQYKDYDFSYPSTVDVDFLTNIGPMLDGLVGGLVEGGLNKMIGDLIYKDDIISSLVCGLYGAVEGVKINDNMNLAQLLAQTDIDFTTANVAKLLTDKDYGQTYASVAKTIEKAGSWSKVNKDSLHWGVTDRDSFVHALCAALRPIYGVLDVLLNDGSLGLFKLIYLPGTDGYTSAIVPLMEAFGLYNIKTQYQYRQDMSKEYDAILLDILNPLLDKVEDILNAPIEMLCDILPNLSLFFANDGLLQLIDNLLLPITALLDSLKPIVDVNELLKAVGLDIEKEISKLGLKVNGFKFDIYNLSATLKPLIGADNIVGLLNSVLGLIKIGGSPLGIELMPIDWFQLASHGELITDEASQAATFGSRMYVKADQSEVLIAVLRYLVNTINYGDNFDTISSLIGGLLPEASDSVSDMISHVLGMLSGDTDEVISSLCDLLKTLA